ncbi:hypothetical protein K2173_012357 [Erythroxylum novogranatense]|uniref:Protein N-terminal asparagine amidohydrolase n=1 Tax=Erythroxylum novogranatense TaxID=1862640 RepID=A0AAV8U9S7_9ROSI|nr:hypothetical protein K2173_012357 [Erythroxylum novogranatense]
MIFVDGLPFSSFRRSSSSNQPLGGCGTLTSLMKHPTLLTASSSFKAMQETKIVLDGSGLQSSAPTGRWVYVFQREYATADPALVDFIGTDEATTCVGIVIWNPKNKMTSVAHMDSPKIVEIGLTQMLSRIINNMSDVDLDIHLIGGFQDASLEHSDGSTRSNSHGKSDGYSLPLCSKIIQTLEKRPERFHIRTLFVLEDNTIWDSKRNARPIFHGFRVETSNGSVIPASFDRSSRCPDEIVRRIRVTASSDDPSWNGKLLETYDTQKDRFVIEPCSWTEFLLHLASTFQRLSDAEILQDCSTSPSAEGPDFVDNLRRGWDYLIENPQWKHTFPGRQPRIFERTTDGGCWNKWKRCSPPQQAAVLGARAP